MTMFLPSPYDVVDTHRLLCPQQNHLDHHYPNAVVWGGEIDSTGSARRRSSSPAASIPTHCNYFSSSSDRAIIIHQMPHELIRPDYDPIQPSSSSIDPTADDNWLNLRLGSHDRPTSSSSTRGGGGLVDLDLLPARTNISHQQQQHQLRQQLIIPINTTASASGAPPKPVALLHRFPKPENNWALMRPSNSIGGNPAAASTSLMPMGPNLCARPNVSGCGEGTLRIVRPPRRHHVGVWFMLQASRNQVREPFLPQIPKSYLRIKNGHMTIRLLIKYLVQKLALESESEVEIRCGGQELEPILTLQHVRDSMWFPKRDVALNLHMNSPSSSTSTAAVDSHIMILHYSRPAAAATTGTASSGPIL